MKYLLAILFLSFLPTKYNLQLEDEETYCNARFDFCWTYPERVFHKDNCTANADGITLMNYDSTLAVYAYGAHNPTNQAIDEIYEFYTEPILDNQDSSIVNIRRDFSEDKFEIWVEQLDRFYYRTVVMRDDHYVSLVIDSDISHKDLIDDLIFPFDFGDDL